METWAFCPQGGVEEVLEWQTDIIPCRSREQRQSVRSIPRQEIAHTFHMTAAELTIAASIARMAGTAKVLLPLWTEKAEAASVANGAEEITVNMSNTSLVLNDYVLIWESATKYQTRQVGYIGGSAIELTAAVVGDFSNPLIMPLRQASIMDGVSVQRKHFDIYEVGVRFMLTDTRDEANATPLGLGTYLTRPLLDIDLILDSALNEEFFREYTELDSGAGLVARSPGRLVPAKRSNMTITTLDASDYVPRRKWLCALYGRQKSFWIPSRLADFTLTNNVLSSDTHILVSDANMRTIGTFPFHLYIERSDGAAVKCQVNSAQAESAGVERLNLSAAIGTGLSTTTVTRVSFLTRYRLDTDRIEFAHSLQHAVTITANLVEVFQ